MKRYILATVLFGLFLMGCDRSHYEYITTGKTEIIVTTITIEVPVIIPSTPSVHVPLPHRRHQHRDRH